MLQINSLDQSLPLFQALSSSLRAKLLMLLNSRGSMTLKEISDSLQVPPSTVSPHIQKLLDCRLVYAEMVPARNILQYHTGITGQISIDFSAAANPCLDFQTEIPIGQYADVSVSPTCGLANASAFLGRLDEPRFFTHPAHQESEILWFTTGYIEYFLPNYIQLRSIVESIELSFEIASEAPRYNNDWPSDITFSLNGHILGVWTSPGDFGDHKGKNNPDWWYPFINQYGLLKTLTLNQEGCFLDGNRFSDVTCHDLNLTDQSILRFRMEVRKDAAHPGGLTLFGKSFGDHSQGILISIRYSLSPEV